MYGMNITTVSLLLLKSNLSLNGRLVQISPTNCLTVDDMLEGNSPLRKFLREDKNNKDNECEFIYFVSKILIGTFKAISTVPGALVSCYVISSCQGRTKIAI